MIISMQEKEHKITARIRVFLDVGPRSVKNAYT